MNDFDQAPNRGGMYLLLLGCTVAAVVLGLMLGKGSFSWLFPVVVFLGGLAAVLLRRRGKRRGP